jgi:hypothetical protein
MMPTHDLPEPDRSWFRCHYCNGRVDLNDTPMPKDAWVKGVVSPEYRYACPTCRTASVNPRPNPDYFKCLSCQTNVNIPGPERRDWQFDPLARLKVVNDVIQYVGYCPRCLDERAALRRARARLETAARQNGGKVEFQMARVRQLTVSFREERDTEGALRYSEIEATARAVWLEMLVADWAKFPDFMRWLRLQAPQPEEEAA